MMDYRREVLWVVGAFVAGFLLATALLFGITSVYFIGPVLLVGMVLALVLGAVSSALVSLGALMRPVSRGAAPSAAEGQEPRPFPAPLHRPGSGRGVDDHRRAA